MAKRALITGVGGQDGAYLARLLLEKGYQVFGACRRSASGSLWRLRELGIEDAVETVDMDLLEFSNVLSVVKQVQPDEVYNLAAQSFVGSSFQQPLFTGDVDALGVTRVLESIRTACPAARFYQASTSEMFGKVRETPQTESTPFHPRSPYAVAKLYGHWITTNYREAHGMYTASGILFNHESPLRGAEFVTRKITMGLSRAVRDKSFVVNLGNLEAERDWGFAGDYVDGMWRMLQQDVPGDYVLGTGIKTSVRRFVSLAAAAAGFDVQWRGEAEGTEGFDNRTGRVVVRVDPAFYRPAEVDLLLADSTKARTTLGWEPKVMLPALVELMMKADMDRQHH